MRKYFKLLILCTAANAMATDDLSTKFISSSPEMNQKLVQELTHADIPHDVDRSGYIWYDRKYQKIVNALSFELTRDEFRPYKKTMIPGDNVVSEVRPHTDMKGALFVTGYESKFGNFVTAVTFELASDKKLAPEDYETVSALLEELSVKYREWRTGAE